MPGGIGGWAGRLHCRSEDDGREGQPKEGMCVGGRVQSRVDVDECDGGGRRRRRRSRRRRRMELGRRYPPTFLPPRSNAAEENGTDGEGTTNTGIGGIDPTRHANVLVSRRGSYVSKHTGTFVRIHLFIEQCSTSSWGKPTPRTKRGSEGFKEITGIHPSYLYGTAS